MATKTKSDLLAEIETKNEEIKNLKEEVKKLERYKQYEAMTDELAAMRESFVNSGFTKTEAFEMVKTILATTANNVFSEPSSKVSYRPYR